MTASLMRLSSLQATTTTRTINKLARTIEDDDVGELTLTFAARYLEQLERERAYRLEPEKEPDEDDLSDDDTITTTPSHDLPEQMCLELATPATAPLPKTISLPCIIELPFSSGQIEHDSILWERMVHNETNAKMIESNNGRQVGN